MTDSDINTFHKWQSLRESYRRIAGRGEVLMHIIGKRIWESLTREFEDHTDSPRINVLVLASAVGMVVALLSMPMPYDDLYRHAVAYLYDYDYLKLYPFMDFPSWNYWIGFERALAWLQQGPFGLSRVITVRVVQVTGLILSFAVVIAALWKRLRSRPDAQYWAMALILMVFPIVATRAVINARPEGFAAIWLFSAFILRPWLWVAIGAAIAPMYGLLPIYAVGALCLDTTWRRKLTALVVVLLLQTGFWIWYTDGRWLELFDYMRRWLANRTVPVTENYPLLAWMVMDKAAIAMTVTLFLARSYCGGKWKDIRTPVLSCAAVAAVFVASNMVRYVTLVLVIESVITAVFLAACKQALYIRHLTLRIGLFVMLAFSPLIVVRGYELPKFALPQGARVFAVGGGALAAPFYAQGTIEVLPSMEHGGNAREIRDAFAEALKKGSFDCQFLTDFGVTHVIENYMKGPPPACLKLKEVNLAWKLWENSNLRKTPYGPR